MTLKKKRNICGALALTGLLSIIGQGVVPVFGGDMDGWHILYSLLATAVFTALWYRFRGLYRDEQFYRRYRSISGD